MRRIFYDTEFIDDGSTIELISIGMVADNGEEYYGINGELELRRLPDLSWHMENTVPSLPIGTRDDDKLGWDLSHPDATLIKSRAKLRLEVFEFIYKNSDNVGPTLNDNIELWAWYGAYDHVVLAQLWGPMNDLPGSVPKYTNDFKQELERKIQLTGNSRLRFILPKMEEGSLHNALDDARLLKRRYEWLTSFING